MTEHPVTIVKRDQRRRWVNRLLLLLVVITAVLSATCIILLRSPELSKEELLARLNALPSRTTILEMRQLLGSPIKMKSGNLCWFISYHSLNETDQIIVVAHVDDDELITFKHFADYRYVGSSAWLARWQILQLKIGWLKP
jgi:hypothetical protein